MTNQGITVQVILSLFLASPQQVRRSLVLVLARVAVYGKRNEVRPGFAQLTGQLVLSLEQRNASPRLNAWDPPPVAICYAGKPLPWKVREVIANIVW